MSQGSPPSAPPPRANPGRDETRASIARLEAERSRLRGRNRWLWTLAILGVALGAGVFAWLYEIHVLDYAVIEDVVVDRRGANQGRLEISFRVISPGKVDYRRTSGEIETRMIDYFSTPGPVSRSWSWTYEPGKEIDLALEYRAGWVRDRFTKSFPTAKSADIVILMDTTESMNDSIELLKERCLEFSQALIRKQLPHRFALVGFGDAEMDEWLDSRGIRGDVEQFRTDVAEVRRFEGGDLPESALDAIEEALTLPFDSSASLRFFLVTDAGFHEPSRKGLSAADLADRLELSGVLLSVFSRERFRDAYAPLLKGGGRFQELGAFGELLSEGRILED